MAEAGFWANLQPRLEGFELLELIKDQGFQILVVTKGPPDSSVAWADKVAWCRRYLPGVPVVVTDDKSRVHGHVLVDDWMPYVDAWQAQWPKGLAIVPEQPWNANMLLGPRCIRDRRGGREKVLTALRSCYDSLTRTDPA
jgi:hypothetical protein